MNRVKVAMVGCGWFANFHLDHLLMMADVEVVAFASPNSEKLKAIGARVPEANLYESHSDMFEQEDQIDALFICITPSRHEDIEILAARKGIHIYVEKPIEVSLDRAREIDDIIKDSGIISSVGYQERYNPEVVNLKQRLAKKKVGLISGSWIGGMPQVHWWRQKAMSGGQVVEQTTHIFDMLRYLFGEVTQVYSKAIIGLIQGVEHYDIEDASSTTVTFESGQVANIMTACYMEEEVPYNRVGFQIFCTDEVIDYHWGDKVMYISGNDTETVDSSKDAHYRSAEVFIQAVKTKNPDLIKSTYSDGLKTLQLTLAANESMIKNKPIDL